MKDLRQLLNLFNIQTNNLDLYEEAFTHKSYSNENNNKRDYQRLEFLGDAILELLTTELIYKLYPSLTEGEMTIIRSSSVKGDALSEFAQNLGLDKYIRFGNSKIDFQSNTKIFADIFESFTAAIYLDQGRDKVEEFLEKTIFKFIRTAGNKELKNPKTLLQEYLQLESREAIEYKTEEFKNEFVSNIYHDGNHFGKGFGKTKKEAEVNAAKQALKLVGKVN